MSLYLIVFLLLVGFAAYELKKNETQKILYWVAFFLLTAMLCLRYGQGTDYYGYWVNFLNTPALTDFSALLESGIHGEPGWLLVCSIFQMLNIPYRVLVGVVAVLDMYLLHRFISRHSPRMTVTLMIAFPTIYMTYAMSALRQGLVMLVFLGVLLDLFQERKFVPYVIVSLICTLFHSSAWFFMVPLVGQFIPLNTKKTLIFMALAAIAGFSTSWLLTMISDALAYYAEIGMSITALGERLVSTAVILAVFHNELEGKTEEDRPMLKLMLQVFLYGSIVYCFFAWNALIASRFSVFFKAVEIVLFAIAMTRPGAQRYAVVAYVLALTVIMYFKNIDSYIYQGEYFDTINVWNYPYLSLFDRDAVESCRTIPYDPSIFLGK